MEIEEREELEFLRGVSDILEEAIIGYDNKILTDTRDIIDEIETRDLRETININEEEI